MFYYCQFQPSPAIYNQKGKTGGGTTAMQRLYWAVQRLLKDRKGQDLVEYALMAASVAVVAGAFFPPTVMPAVSGIFSRVVTLFNQTP
jgi:Flp pilus assembly pilin Flp